MGLGLAFILILLVCGYTATLASFLVVEKKVAPVIDSLDDAIRRNFKVCAHISHQQTLIAAGMEESNIIVIGSRSAVLSSIGSVCDAAAMSSEDFEAAQASNRGAYCNLERVGLPLGSIMVGMPVAEKWVRQLRYVITQLSMDGHLQQSLSQYRPQTYCSVLESDTSASPVALTLEGMLGPFLVTFFLSLLGVAAHVLRLGCRKTINAAHDLGIDEKVSVRIRKISSKVPRTSRTSLGSSEPKPGQPGQPGQPGSRPRLVRSSSGKSSLDSQETASPSAASPSLSLRDADLGNAGDAVRQYFEGRDSNIITRLESIERLMTLMVEAEEDVSVAY